MIACISGPNKFGGKNAVVGELGGAAVLQQGVLLLRLLQQGDSVVLLLAGHVAGVQLSVEERELQVFLVGPVVRQLLLLRLFRWPARQQGSFAEEAVRLGCWLIADLQVVHLQQVFSPGPFLLAGPREQKLLLLPGLRRLHSQIASLQFRGLVLVVPLVERLQHFMVVFEPGLL